MSEFTVDGSKIGLGEIKADQSFGMMKKAGQVQEDISKITLDAQNSLAKVFRDASILQKLDKNKSEDQRTLARMAKEYKSDFGTKVTDVWEMTLDFIGNKLDFKIAESRNLTQLKVAEVQVAFIEDIAGIDTKAKKEKFEKNLQLDEAQKVANELVTKILGIESTEATEDDKKSHSK